MSDYFVYINSLKLNSSFIIGIGSLNTINIIADCHTAKIPREIDDRKTTNLGGVGLCEKGIIISCTIAVMLSTEKIMFPIVIDLNAVFLNSLVL